MSSSSEKHTYSIESINTSQIDCVNMGHNMEEEKEKHIEEERNKLINNTYNNEKEYKFNQTYQEMINDLQKKLETKDLTEAYDKCNLAYERKTNLSILTMKDKLLSLIDTNPVVIIEGPTGCGKTTQIPQFILNDFIKKRIHCNIIVTQPRRIAAISIAKRVSQETVWPLGTIVGYKVGMKSEVSSDTRLTYCTTEVLLYQLICKKHMQDYTHIILDEIHERSQELDLLLLVVKKLLQANSRHVKVILMSATINVTKFTNYFSMKTDQLIPVQVVKIPEKRSYEIHTYYLDEIQNLGTIPQVSYTEPKVTKDMINFCVRLIIALDEVDKNDNKNETDPGLFQRHAVLVFLPGLCEIEELYNLLSLKCYASKLWDLIILHSLISNDEQENAFNEPLLGYRRIILSTNIAESSITVSDVKYVIDFCLVKMLTVSSVTNYQCLQLAWASKANCIQRAGRTGRIMDGRVYRLIPKVFYYTLEKESVPEMIRAPLANVLLKMKVFGLDEPRILLASLLDPPNLRNLKKTILLLKEAGALVNKEYKIQPFDGQLTDLGRVMAHLPLDICISKLIMLGHVFSILRDAIILGASMAVKDMFSNQYHQTISAYTIRRKWAGESDSDSIACLNVYKMWQNEKANRRITTYIAEKQWAKRNGIQLRTLRELDALVNEITKRLERIGIKESIGINKVIWKDNDRIFILQVILAGAFYPNYFTKDPQNTQLLNDNVLRTLNGLDPMKTVYLRGWTMDQPGLLYAKKFQDVFSKYQNIPMSQVMVSFDESKRVYAQYRKRETSGNKNLCKIAPFVYQAVKMRQCNVPITIDILDREKACSRIKDYDLTKYHHTVLFNKDVTKADGYTCSISKIRPKLPGLDVTAIPLYIRNIINPGHFWATLNNNDTFKTRKKIEKILNTEALEKLHFRPEIGEIVAAPMNKKRSLTYQRAIIEEYVSGNENLIHILFIDYGFMRRILWSDLKRIPQDGVILELAALAFQCSLACIGPSNQGSNLDGQWSQISQDYFTKQIYESIEIFGHVYSVVDNVVILQLNIINEENTLFNINEYLIKYGYAVRKEENYLSQYNHDLRLNVIKMSPEEKSYYEELQHDQDYLLKTYPEPPKKEDCNSSIILQGPYSPLEIEMMHLIVAGKSNKVRMDTLSVNSVLLDHNPDCSYGRLLVAQNVNQAASNNQLILRNTTYLPYIPGLTALLTLIFTPHIELRRSPLGTYYTGALCGLGPINNCTNESLYLDHDIEIPFNVEITMDDLREINKLRYWMNVGMQLDDNMDDDEHIIEVQNKIKYALFAIINRQRKLQNPIEIDNFDSWNLYDESCFLHPVQVEMEKSYIPIYHLHSALELRERNDELEEMLKHLSELQKQADVDIIKTGRITAFCKLCRVETFSVLTLRGHLYSEQHIKNKKKLNI